MPDDNKHPLLKHPEKLRKDYLFLLANMAAADGKLEEKEIESLKTFCRFAGLGKESLDAVLKSAKAGGEFKISETIQSLKSSDLKYSIMTDCIFMAYDDGIMAKEELEEISKLSNALDIKPEQVAAIRFYVENVNTLRKKLQVVDVKKLGEEVFNKLKAVSIPLDTVAYSFESITHCDTNEMKELFKVLGFGLGMLTGIGPLIMLGLFGWKGVKWLGHKLQISHGRN